MLILAAFIHNIDQVVTSGEIPSNPTEMELSRLARFSVGDKQITECVLAQASSEDMCEGDLLTVAVTKQSSDTMQNRLPTWRFLQDITAAA